MSKVPLDLNALDASGRGLRVTFRWRHDRFSHSIALVDGRKAWTLLESVEGASGQPCPPSPPLQQLVAQEREAGSPVILGLGMAGRNHWSFSVEALNNLPSVQFDVACRIEKWHDHLGSRFRSKIAPVAVIGPHEAEAEFAIGTLRCRLAVEPSVDGLQGVLGIRDGGLTIRAAQGTPSGTLTARWIYKLFLPA